MGTRSHAKQNGKMHSNDIYLYATSSNEGGAVQFQSHHNNIFMTKTSHKSVFSSKLKENCQKSFRPILNF
jgi:hypothetical protein